MSISTLSFNTSTRTSLMKLQTQLNESVQELNSGRHADIGATLGRLTGAAVSARAQESSFKEQQTSNGLITSRLENVDASLATINSGAETLRNLLIGSGVVTDFGIIVTQAKSSLQQLSTALNATSNGEYIFGGTNTEDAPIAYDVSADTTVAAARFETFLAAAVGGVRADLTEEQMEGYLSDAGIDIGGEIYRFKDLFEDDWSAQWSGASSAEGIASRISKSETIISSGNANDQAFRDIAAAYTVLADLDIEALNGAARKVVTEFASQKLNASSSEVTVAQADIGIKLGRIDAANTELKRQQDIMSSTVAALEEVDITEAGLQVTALKTQLDAAYAVTGRIQDLSLLNYI